MLIDNETLVIARLNHDAGDYKDNSDTLITIAANLTATDIKKVWKKAVDNPEEYCEEITNLMEELFEEVQKGETEAAQEREQEEE